MLKAIIVGAGRGSRLNTLTDDQPKCYTSVRNKRILDWSLGALSEAGLSDVVFVGGYRIEQIKRDYPKLAFRHNINWEKNNVLASLFCAEKDMDDGFISCYSDILFRRELIKRLIGHQSDIVISIDTDWRNRYVHRSQHPENDAEKVICNADQVIRIERSIEPELVSGEFTGVVKFNVSGAQKLREYYRKVSKLYSGKCWQDGVVFEKAYLIHLLQYMIEDGIEIKAISTSGGYWEIDTEEDLKFANQSW